MNLKRLDHLATKTCGWILVVTSVMFFAYHYFHLLMLTGGFLIGCAMIKIEEVESK